MALYELRALDRAKWPGQSTPAGERTSNFSASWSDTLEVLTRELEYLGAKNVVLEVAYRSQDLRLDGTLRANARAPEDPGVVLSFDSVHGPLRYSCDRFDGGRWRCDGQKRSPGWQCNVRAIALGLEALRKVERYGIATRAEQYTGWRALPSGIALSAAPMSREEAAVVLIDLAGNYWGTEAAGNQITVGEFLNELAAGDPNGLILAGYRDALKRHHPDQGGRREAFDALQRARDVLLGSAQQVSAAVANAHVGDGQRSAAERSRIR